VGSTISGSTAVFKHTSQSEVSAGSGSGNCRTQGVEEVLDWAPRASIRKNIEPASRIVRRCANKGHARGPEVLSCAWQACQTCERVEGLHVPSGDLPPKVAGPQKRE